MKFGIKNPYTNKMFFTISSANFFVISYNLKTSVKLQLQLVTVTVTAPSPP